MPDDSLFHYSRFGFAFDVYANRIETVKGTLMKRRLTIPMRQVSGVEVKGATRKLHVNTDSGKHEFNLGGKAEDARAVIASNLP